MQALRPLHRNPVPARRRDQAEGRVLRAGAMPLPVVIHLPAELAVQPGILTWHVVDVIGRARLDALPRLKPRLDGHHEAAALPWV